jgi:FkbM family methyltransferase
MRLLSESLRQGLRTLVRRVGRKLLGITSLDDDTESSDLARWGWLDTIGIGTLVDVGANTGQTVEWFHRLRPESPVYCFEPLPDCFAKLLSALADNPQAKAFNVALGETEGERTFYRSRFSPSSSLLPMGTLHKELFPETSEGSLETVAVRRLDSYLDEIAISGGLLIKIDVQGAEAQVLRGGHQLLALADAVVAEVCLLPLYEGQSTFPEILSLLDESDFAFMGLLDQYLRPSDSLPVYCDALFIKRDALRRSGALRAL